MKYISKLLSLVMMLWVPCNLRASSTLELIYHAPSTKWMGALPLGNGRIGAMVYGGTSHETIALNEVSMWSGQPDPEGNNICGKEHLAEVRKCFFKDDIAKGNDLGTKYLTGKGKSYGTHLPMGDLIIDFVGRNGEVSDYTRRLSLNRAVADITYNIGDVTYTNEYFCSNPAQVLIGHFSASQKHKVSADLSLKLLRHNQIKIEGNEIIVTGDAKFDKWGEGGVLYTSRIKVNAKGGSITAADDKISVRDADDMTVIVDIRTNFNNPDYLNQCKKTVDEAAARPFKTLRKEHIADFQNIFNRMAIDLGANETSESTDELFKKVHGGKPDVAFDAMFFQYGRYMLISSSRENSPLPANLQGIWNDNLACNMPWTCDYHLDINIEQNYWSANIANMAECNYPLFNYIKLLSQYGHETAKKMYGCNGWVAHTINNVWGATYPGGGVNWAMNVTAGAWLATQLWVHYLYTQDKDYLKNTGYPLLKETARFFVDYMVTDPRTGYLVTGPSISPENAFRLKDGGVYCLSMMPTIDRAVVHYIYQACIKASEILNVDADFRSRLEHDIQLLPPYQLGKRGDLKEWNLDVERQDYSHRHSSHLLGLYPFGEISPAHTPELAEGCRKFISLQTQDKGWEDTEWTRGNMICTYARLLDGNSAYNSLMGLYTGFMRENLMTVSPAGVAGAQEDIFSFDATEAAVAGMCEMILQSYEGTLNFLPALPDAWNNGAIKGVCAEGGITLDIIWKNGKVTKTTLLSKEDKTVTCHINGETKSIKLKAGKKTTLKF